jgi:hypothetical protein
LSGKGYSRESGREMRAPGIWVASVIPGRCEASNSDAQLRI